MGKITTTSGAGPTLVLVSKSRASLPWNKQSYQSFSNIANSHHSKDSYIHTISKKFTTRAMSACSETHILSRADSLTFCQQTKVFIQNLTQSREFGTNWFLNLILPR